MHAAIAGSAEESVRTMHALSVFQQSFAVAERLLQQFQLASGLAWAAPSDGLLRSIPEEWVAGGTTGVQLAANEHVLILFRSTARIPGSLRVRGGLDFLLRQAVVVACTALETLLWETVRGGALTVVRARRRGADEEIRNLTLTLEEYVSLDTATDPENRLRQILLARFDRQVLHDIAAIDRVARVLGVKDFWQQIELAAGAPATNLRALVADLVARRNLITHRADRADDGEAADGHGLRPITLARTNLRLQATNTVATAAADVFASALARLSKESSR